MAQSPNRRIQRSRDELENDEVQMTKQPAVIVSDLVIRHYFVIRHSDFVIHRPAPEQRARASLDYRHEHEHDYSDTSTHHDTSICFLIRKGNAL